MFDKNGEGAIFLSYSQEDDETASQLVSLLEYNGIRLIWDKHDLDYGDSLGLFMKTGRYTPCSVLLVSDNYLTSRSCMHEVCEMMEEEDFARRVRPMILKSADVFSLEGRIRYIQYWDKEYRNLSKNIQGISAPETAVELWRELDRLGRIRCRIDPFLAYLSDRYSCTTVTQFVAELAKEAGRGACAV